MTALLKARTGLTIVIVALVALVGAGVASAQEPGGDGPGGQFSADALENFYQRATLHVELLQLRLDLANKVVGRVQELIDKAKEEGKDTSDLEGALAAFKTAIGQAQAGHDTAASVMSAHAGFDASGKVADTEQARQTLKAARDALREGGHTLREGTREFRRAFREWRASHRQQTQP